MKRDLETMTANLSASVTSTQPLDIVARLRFQASPRAILPSHDLMLEAADEIEQLRNQIAYESEHRE